MEKGIYKAVADAMAEIQPIAKSKRNSQQGFQYRGIDDVMNELNPILVKHRIFVYPEVINSQRQERQTQKGGALIYSILTIKYHFAHEDGSEICVTVIGEGMDSGDKASNKAMAIGMKYACLQVFCIPTDDMTDPDATTPPPSTPINGNGKQNETKPNDKQDIKEIGEKIGQIMNANNPDQKPYFSQKEKDMERTIYQNANGLQAVKNQYERLKNSLTTRENEYMKTVPFGEKEFKDDIPESKQEELIN